MDVASFPKRQHLYVNLHDFLKEPVLFIGTTLRTARRLPSGFRKNGMYCAVCEESLFVLFDTLKGEG